MSRVRIPRLLILGLLATPAAAQTSEVVFDFSPFSPDTVGGEMMVLGTQPLNIVRARVDAIYVGNDTVPWSLWVNFALPTGIAGVDSATEGWEGAGTFSASLQTDALNGYVAPAPGQSSYLWFVEWAGGKAFDLPGGGVGFGPVDGVFTQLVLTLTVVDAPPAAWLDLGHALAGELGAPLLTGNGNLCRSAPGSLVLSNARPGGTTFLVTGLSSVWAPFKGGLLLPASDLVLALPIDAAGTSALPFSFPIGMPMGLQFWVQHWIPDPAGVAGFAASNALLATVPADC